MPASQLKRLKASLREQGITGPQKSKKQKSAQKSRPTSEKIERSTALQKIRDSFNPFELRQAPRPAKFTHANTSTKNGSSGRYKEVLHRPGVARSAGEDMRRATLLPEVQRRNRVGGLIDRRIGEGDADMTPEEKAAQRFVRAQQKRKGAAFDLENSDDEIGGALLTHGGRGLADLEADDFEAMRSEGSDGEEEVLTNKRQRADDEIDAPERKKSRREVMHEVIAKSKAYKEERQKTKEEDEDLREELDKGLADIVALLHGQKAVQKPGVESAPSSTGTGPAMNPERQRLMDGLNGVNLDKQYDSRMRQLAQDSRAKPSERTKTAEEKAADEAKRLQLLEDKRTKRMRGEATSDGEDDGGKIQAEATSDALEDNEDVEDEAAGFGLGAGTQPKSRKDKEKIVLDEEDDFALDEDLVDSDSEVDLSALSDEDGELSDSEEGSGELPEDEEDEFVRDILQDKDGGPDKTGANDAPLGLAFKYPCPRTHPELLEIVSKSPVEDLTTIIQRIRALYHPSLSASNKESMADFAAALVEHIAYMAEHKQSLAIAEQVIRHLHSLSRTYPVEIAVAFRTQLQALQEQSQPSAGHLLILTAISSIYPTSDHFHSVVTPAMTLIARYLGLTKPTSVESNILGIYLVRLGLQYQRLSKRYIPEAVRFTYAALSRPSQLTVEIKQGHLTNLKTMAELWRDQPAFIQIFDPFVPVLTKLSAKSELQTLQILLRAARLSLKPLQLHNHKKLPIRTNIPKFEEGFNPDKHYDPDKERSEANKLRKEYKREHKGAIRELRKDANFLAREQLREKKDRDAAYEKKYKRLVAEIQGEEGYEANAYEREKASRKKARK